MFGRKRQAKSAAMLVKVENDTLRKALNDIACLEQKKPPKDGVSTGTDWEMTTFLIRERAKLALSVVDGIREKRRFNDD